MKAVRSWARRHPKLASNIIAPAAFSLSAGVFGGGIGGIAAVSLPAQDTTNTSAHVTAVIPTGMQSSVHQVKAAHRNLLPNDVAVGVAVGGTGVLVGGFGMGILVGEAAR